MIVSVSCVYNIRQTFQILRPTILLLEHIRAEVKARSNRRHNLKDVSPLEMYRPKGA